MMISEKMAPAFKPGDVVTFGRPNGEKTRGEVLRANVKSVSVRQVEARGGHPIGTKWRVAPSCCTLVHGGAATATQAPPVAWTAPTAERAKAIVLEIGRLYSALSPENLSCDGELPRSRWAPRAAAIRRSMAALFAELGRTVTEEETWKAFDATRSS